MHKRSTSSIGLIAVLASTCLTANAQVAGAPPNGITITATPVVGSEKVHVTGNAPAAGPVQVALYVTYSRDMPTVLMTRRIVSTDATGRYDTTVSTAPAFFRNAIITVVAHSASGGPDARATLSVGAPNVPAPPDDLPASVR